MYTTITEGRAKLLVPRAEKISREMPVFYNPIMKLNRDISVLLLNSVESRKMRIADPLAGTGVRSIRFALELEKDKIKSISANDHSQAACSLIRKNISLNTVKNIEISSMDANQFLAGRGFDYIDIDPFGYPGPFTDAAAKCLSRNGILAVTATDTAALCGTAPSACARKYWARPMKNEFMHETGLRILMRFAQLIFSKYDKSLIPLFSYSREHYMRMFFISKKGNAHKILGQHGFILYCRKCLERKVSKDIFNKKECSCGSKLEYAGPLWLGNLWDRKTLGIMVKKNKDAELGKFLKVISDESKINSAGFYNIHEICSKYKLNVPKTEALIKAIRKTHRVSMTHLSPLGIRTRLSPKRLAQIIKSIR